MESPRHPCLLTCPALSLYPGIPKSDIMMLRNLNYTLALVSVLAFGWMHETQGEEKSKTPVRVVFMVGEMEYQTAESLPAFARQYLINDGVHCTFIHVNPNDPNDFPGLTGALKKADVLVLSVRRRTPPVGQLEAVRAFLDSGGGLVGIRTSSHAFGREPADALHAKWDEFDRDILGMDYENHYGNKPPEDPISHIRILPWWQHHPILEGIQLEGNTFTSTSHLYRNRRPDDGVSVLMVGNVGANGTMNEPVAWTNTHRKLKVFYTSLGNLDDFQLPHFNQMLKNAILWAGQNGSSPSQ